MTLPKWIKDQFKEAMKDEDFALAVDERTSLYSEKEAIFEDDVLNTCYDMPFPAAFIPANKMNDQVWEDDFLKPIKKSRTFVMDQGNMKYDSSAGMPRADSIPDHATHVEYNKWYEIRRLDDDEYALCEELRIAHIQKAVDNVIKDIKIEAKDLKRRRQVEAKRAATRVDEPKKLRTIEVSMTDEQFAQFQSLFKE